MAKAKDYYSKSVAEAIRQACADFATSQEKLDIEIVETGSAGIFGLCKKRAHIRVARKQKADAAKKTAKAKIESRPVDQEPVKEVEAPAAPVEQEKAAEPKRPVKGREKGRGKPKNKKEDEARVQPVEPEPLEPPSEEVLVAVRNDLDQILQLMGFPSEVSVSFAEASIQCQINGEYEESIVGPQGRTLDSLQYLLRKMSSRVLPDRMMIDLNAGDFRERRIEELKNSAVELAEKVKADGKTQAIPGLNPSERRVVHVALQDDKSVRSRSVGDGLFKKVLIYKPGSKAKKSGGRRRGRQGGGSADK
ncbi:MAG TPA: RNA-binding protein [Desulfobacteraceae bacterium]|nr:RNA-binding protein [Desulfobacteraceae bacterium]